MSIAASHQEDVAQLASVDGINHLQGTVEGQLKSRLTSEVLTKAIVYLIRVS